MSLNGAASERLEASVGASLGGAVLLAGGMQVPPMTRAAGRSLLDLHLTPTRTVLGLWLDRLAPALGGSGVRVLCGGEAPAPIGMEPDVRELVAIEREGKELRGPGGALADACVDMAPETSVIAADAARVLLGGLEEAVAAHARHRADITLLAQPDMSPAGVSILRRSVLELAPRSGFMDLKEQLLDRAIKGGFNVRVVRLEEEGSAPLRTRRQFLDAARRIAGLPIGGGSVRARRVVPDTGGELRVISEEAVVERGARVLESIVTPGAVVRSGALVARSIVAPGAIVEAGAEVVDAVVSRAGVMGDERANARQRRGMIR